MLGLTAAPAQACEESPGRTHDTRKRREPPTRDHRGRDRGSPRAADLIGDLRVSHAIERIER